jgi:hypothetical protein
MKELRQEENGDRKELWKKGVGTGRSCERKELGQEGCGGWRELRLKEVGQEGFGTGRSWGCKELDRKKLRIWGNEWIGTMSWAERSGARKETGMEGLKLGGTRSLPFIYVYI